MVVKATVSFAGQVSMAADEVRNIPDEVAAPLIRDGYLVEEATEAKTSTRSRKTTKKK